MKEIYFCPRLTGFAGRDAADGIGVNCLPDLPTAPTPLLTDGRISGDCI